MTTHLPAAAENRVLASLPAEVRGRLQPLLVPVFCAHGEVLVRAHEPSRFVYFPVTAVLSLIVELSSGQALEVGVVGRRDCVGAHLVDGAVPIFAAVVQIPGAAWRVEAAALQRETARTAALAGPVGASLQRLSDAAMRTAACAVFHPIEQRCVHWLLRMSELAGHDELAVTHETLASMLGVRRASVTLVLRSLHRRGLLVEHRGRISLVDRAGLEAVCCECLESARAVTHVRTQTRRS